ncbi:hypothetical protein ABT391_02955 [Streptomyces jumonjinensis]|uniref:Uncharacterized protein n=2 Tax=Streptomyces jumonjinensis TaxID=1945 RepID=A0A646KLN0_STRJU|nr:hypothetical protein [Streptomyces jumonjinensis]
MASAGATGRSGIRRLLWSLMPEDREHRDLLAELRRLERDPEFAADQRAEPAEGWRRVQFDKGPAVTGDPRQEHTYFAAVSGEGPVYGTGEIAGTILGTFSTPYLGRALRWTRTQAVRIADRLDPPPGVPWRRALCPVPPALTAEHGDAPTALRNWAGDDAIRQTAYRRLRDGQPVISTFEDHTGRYTLIVWPVPVPVRPANPLPAAPLIRGERSR